MVRRFKLKYDDRKRGWNLYVEHSSGLSWTPVFQNKDTKKDALKRAREIAKAKSPSHLMVENMSGEISETTRYD